MVCLDVDMLVDNGIRRLVGAKIEQAGIVLRPRAEVWLGVVLILAKLVPRCYDARNHVVDSVERDGAVHRGQGEVGPHEGFTAVPIHTVTCRCHPD